MSYVGLYDDAGSKNAFYIIKNRRMNRRLVGFKEFLSKDEAEFSYRVQSRLAKYCLAPNVYGDVGMIRKGGTNELTSYGYLTEVAKPMKECNDNICDGSCMDSDCANGTRISEVVYSLKEHGLEYIDYHTGNFGYVKRDGVWVLVAIDLGVESYGSWDESIYGECEAYEDDDEDGYDECNCACCVALRETV